jgi:hypothetical protein
MLIILALVYLLLLNKQTVKKNRFSYLTRASIVCTLLFLVLSTGAAQTLQNVQELKHRASISSIWNEMQMLQSILEKEEVSRHKILYSKSLALESKSGPYPYWDWYLSRLVNRNYKVSKLSEVGEAPNGAHRIEVLRAGEDFVLYFLPFSESASKVLYIANSGQGKEVSLESINNSSSEYGEKKTFIVKHGLNRFILP